MDWRTAIIKPNKAVNALRFDVRCVECAKDFALHGLFQSSNMLADEDDADTICVIGGCTFTRLPPTLCCPVHIVSRVLSGKPIAGNAEHRKEFSRQLQTATACVLRFLLLLCIFTLLLKSRFSLTRAYADILVLFILPKISAPGVERPVTYRCPFLRSGSPPALISCLPLE